MNVKPFKTDMPVHGRQVWQWAGHRTELSKIEYDRFFQVMVDNETNFIEINNRIYTLYQRTTQTRIMRQLIEIDRRAFEGV